jgi:hypothetical protein
MVESLLGHLTPQLIHEAADEIGGFVTRNRLPPPPPPPPGAAGPATPAATPGQYAGPPPACATEARLIPPQYRRVVLGCDEGGREFIQLQHCVSNSVLASVGGEDAEVLDHDGEGAGEREEEEEGEEEEGEEEEGEESNEDDEGEATYAGGAVRWDALVFPKESSQVLLRLVESYPRWMPLGESKTERDEAGGDDGGGDGGGDDSPLLYALWAAGVLETRGGQGEEFADVAQLAGARLQ